MLRLQHIHIAFPDKILYDDLDWHIRPGQSIGLVGDNGAGKTTLLRLLMGKREPDRGEVLRAPRLRVGYLEQDFSFSTQRPLVDVVVEAVADLSQIEAEMAGLREELAHLAPDSEEQQAVLNRLGHLHEHFDNADGYRLRSDAGRILAGLGFREEDLARPLDSFSGGWQMRAALARLLLSAPDLLLLDEPTNHLDTETIEWLERYLRRYSGTVILVSHDRFFLDRTVSQIAELDRGELKLWSGNYTRFLEQKAEEQERIASEYLRQRERIAELKRFIDRFRYKASKASQVQSRIRMLEKIQRIEIESETRGIRFHFPACERSGDVVLACEGLSHRYGGGPAVFQPLQFHIGRGERVALVGPNGAGKTTLSRIICGLLAPSDGQCRLGHKVELDYYTQEAEEGMDPGATVLEELSKHNTGLGQGQLRSLLGSFLFSGDAVFKRIEVLSGGEKSRLAVAGLLLKKSNFLVLDEPTNHLDIKAKDVLQQALAAYTGTVLVVSHDRWFLDRVVTRVVELRDGGIQDYPGNYSDFLAAREAELAAAEPAANTARDEGGPAGGARPRSKEDRRKATEEKIRKRRILREHEQSATTLERTIEQRENRLSNLEAELSRPEILADGARMSTLTTEYNRIRKELPDLYTRWESAQAEVERTRPELGLEED